MEMCFVCFAATQRATDLEFLLGGDLPILGRLGDPCV